MFCSYLFMSEMQVKTPMHLHESVPSIREGANGHAPCRWGPRQPPDQGWGIQSDSLQTAGKAAFPKLEAWLSQTHEPLSFSPNTATGVHVSILPFPQRDSKEPMWGFTLPQESCRLVPEHLPTTVGSRSTNTALGTCFTAPVSLKNVLKESSPPPMVLSLGI